MSAAETLRTINDIVETLTPLGVKERGEPLRSDEWNRVIDAILSLARLGGQQERRADQKLTADFSPADHDHAGEVDLTWFEPRTRELIAKGTSSPELSVGLRDVDTKLQRALQIAEDYRLEVRRLQEELDAQRIRAASQDRQIKVLTERVESIRTVGDDLTDLRSQFAGLSKTLTEALSLKQIVERGDLEGIGDRVTDLERLRDNLLASDGKLGRYRDLEMRIEEIARGGFSDEVLKNAVSEQLYSAELWSDATTVSRIGTLIDTRTDVRFAGVTDSIEALRGDLDGHQVHSKNLVEALTAQDQRVIGLEGAQAAAVLRLDQLDQRTSAITAQGSRISGLEQRVTVVEGQTKDVSGLFDEIAANKTRITELAGALDRSSRDTNARLGALERDRTALGDLTVRVDGLVTTLSQATTLADDLAIRTLEAEARLDDLGTRLAPVESQVATLGSWRSDVQGPLAQLFDGPTPRVVADRVSTLESQVTAVRAGQDAADQRVATLEISVAETSAALTRFDARLPALERTSTELQSKVESLTDRPALDAEWQQAVEDRLSRTEVGVASSNELGRRTSALEASVKTLSTLVPRVDGLASEVKALRSDVVVLGGRMSPLETRMAELAKTEARLTVLEQRTTSLTAAGLLAARGTLVNKER